MNTNRKLYPLIILILLAGMISACGSSTSSGKKATDDNNGTETGDCTLDSSSIGNCNL